MMDKIKENIKQLKSECIYDESKYVRVNDNDYPIQCSLSEDEIKLEVQDIKQEIKEEWVDNEFEFSSSAATDADVKNEIDPELKFHSSATSYPEAIHDAALSSDPIIKEEYRLANCLLEDSTLTSKDCFEQFDTAGSESLSGSGEVLEEELINKSKASNSTSAVEERIFIEEGRAIDKQNSILNNVDNNMFNWHTIEKLRADLRYQFDDIVSKINTIEQYNICSEALKNLGHLLNASKNENATVHLPQKMSCSAFKIQERRNLRLSRFRLQHKRNTIYYI